MALQDLLLVEDDPSIVTFLRTALKSDHRYRMEHAGSLAQVQELARQRQETGLSPWLVTLLDLGLPDGDGLDILSWLRSIQPQGLIVVLSARHREEDKVRALQQGADDYMTKPFTIGELLARLDAHLRRLWQNPGGLLPSDSWTLEEDVRLLVLDDGRKVALTMKEFLMMRLFLQHAGQVIPYQKLLMGVWGPKHLGQTHYLRIYIQRLREKIEEDPNQPRYLITELGIGYRLLLPEHQEPAL